MMIKQQAVLDRHPEETHLEERAPSYVYHQLADGRMVPIEMGGLVELALSELGARLVDVAEERIPQSAIGLN